MATITHSRLVDGEPRLRTRITKIRDPELGVVEARIDYL